MEKQTPKRTGWQKTRKLFNDIHLWLGLTSGLIVIAVCFSGTVYVFNTEITEWGAPHLYTVKQNSSQQRIPADSLLKKVEAVAGAKVSNVVIPVELDRTYQFIVRKSGENKPGPGITYFANPYTGEIAGTSNDKNAAKEFMSTMFSLHRWLLLDKVKKPIISGIENRKLGSMITGWATIIFTLGCITGLIIWFPQKIKYWRQGLKIKWNAGWKRINHDLHNSLAFYALIFLLLMGLTGPQWSFEWYRTGLQKTLGTYKPGQAGERRGGPGGEGMNKAGSSNEKESKTGEKAMMPVMQHPVTDTAATIVFVPLENYIRTTDSLLAYKGNYMIMLPADAKAKTMVTKTKTGFFAAAAGDRITMDPATGRLIKLEIFKEKPFNEKIAGNIKAIHVGNVFGTFTKILYFLACLIATSLPITGTLIWLNKMKKKTVTVNKKAVAVPATA